MLSFQPAYIETYRNGLLKEKIKSATEMLNGCTLCPRECNVDRLSGDSGICKTQDKVLVSSYNPHFGEEAPLVGQEGSGTIFFAHCNLMCNFCQNYDISHEGHGQVIIDEQLAQIMLQLQNIGCHNINFVTPSHGVAQILSALEIAVKNGLSVPLVYNTGGYDKVETLELLDGVFDIYMPDFKFWDSDIAEKTCNAKDYPEIAQKALVEMHRQVGDLVIDENGIAQRGLLVRHLVLPNDLAGTREVMRFLARKISPDTYVNIMSQYRPCGRAAEIKDLTRSISDKEYQQATGAAKDAGITRLDRPRRA
jgi:putative pyruvate formate lyase activating enzyme